MASGSSPGIQQLKHIVVLMMSGRSFDHMLGSLKGVNPQIDGLTGGETNPDSTGASIQVKPDAQFQGQLDPAPDARFPAVDLQIFGGVASAKSSNRSATMAGFVGSYFSQQKSVERSHLVMNYFASEKLPVLTTLATRYAVFNRWFSSVPGPARCNRTFAHYGTSFGQVTMDLSYSTKEYKSIYERMVSAGHTARCYLFDEVSTSVADPNLLQNQPAIFSTFQEFLIDCQNGTLPDYCFVEPNYADHDAPDGSGVLIASDQHPDHNVQAGESYVASVYNALRSSPLWPHTALLVTYDTHGGLYDHVVPPSCVPDGFVAQPAVTGGPYPFFFDRLGVRVPAVLISPWVPAGSVINEVFEHASIPATVTEQFIGSDSSRSPREIGANTFLQVLTLPAMRASSDVPYFNLGGQTRSTVSGPSVGEERKLRRSRKSGETSQAGSTRSEATSSSEAAPAAPSRASSPIQVHVGPSTHVARDRWTIDDSLDYFPYAYAIYRFMTDPGTTSPLAVSIQAPWGGGKTSLMRMIQSQLDPDAMKLIDVTASANQENGESARVKHILAEMKAAASPSKADPPLRVASPNSAPSVSTDSVRENKTAETTIPPIEKLGARRVTVWFNAWKYESNAQVWAGLADCIVQQISKRLGPVERELFWFKLQLRRLDAGKIRRRIHEEVFSAFAGKLLAWFPAYVGGFGLIGFSLIKHAWLSGGSIFVAELISAWIQFRKAKSATEKQPARISLGDFIQAPDYSANLGFVHEVVEDLRHIFQLIPEKDLPMVIFIDDLDRCSPGKISAVVEAINLFLAGEFPECMFVLGIDDEMVAAALDTAHGDVIAKLPRYAKSTSIGWRFMDKFVQLPFVIPPPREDNLGRYVDSLLSEGKGGRAQVTMEARDTAARLVESGSPASGSSEQVVEQVSKEQPLAAGAQDDLKREVEIIQGMDENIRQFTDQDKGIRDAIASHASRYFSNPRDMKRFVNLFRFYYFLRSARQALGHDVPSVGQLCRWIVFSLKWPEVGRWLRSHTVAQHGDYDSPMGALEQLCQRNETIQKWQQSMSKEFGLDAEGTGWLQDEDLRSFLHRETAEFKKEDRLSSTPKGGLW